MKNFEVIIKNKSTKEELNTYTIEEESPQVARWIGVGRYRREFPDNKSIEICTTVKKSTRKIVVIQQPVKWKMEVL